MQIREITAEETWPLRHRVMWPDQPLDFVKVPEDATGVHFGAWEQEQLVSVISQFVHGPEAQFRKFATETAVQGKGYGSALLRHVMQYAREQHVQVLWCHARQHKAAFYAKFGFESTGTPFPKNGKIYVRMQKQLSRE